MQQRASQTHFKFQSDSINPGNGLLPAVNDTTLNSNLILLILCLCTQEVQTQEIL